MEFDSGQTVQTVNRPIPGKEKKPLRRWIPPVLLLLPLMLFLFGFFVVPMLHILYLSFIPEESSTQTEFTLENFLRFFTDPYYLGNLWLTVKISLWTVGITLILGYPVSLTMVRSSPRMRTILTFLVASPLLISIVVRNFGWYLLLLQNGTLNQVLMGLGIIDSPLRLLSSETGVIIGLSNAYLPFMILSIAASLYNIDPNLERASAILGANPIKTFFSVTFPLSLPGVVAGTVLVFSMSMSAYVTPAMMGGAKVPMLPVVAYDQIVNLMRWPFGSAVSFILLGVTYLSVLLFTRAMERGRFREVFR